MSQRHVTWESRREDLAPGYNAPRTTMPEPSSAANANPKSNLQRWFLAAAFVLLIAILVAELALSLQHETQTWDEACHLFAGYSYWTRSDFGMNPEHPPLVKLLAALPLLPMSMQVPVLQDRQFKVEAFLSGERFLYSNKAETVLFRARMAAALLTVLLAGLVFFAGREMFGTVAAFLALVLLVFDPKLLAHGALITTDAGLSCFLFAAVYAFYRYLKKPSVLRLLFGAVAAGAALASKHSGILVFPILTVLAVMEVIRNPIQAAPASGIPCTGASKISDPTQTRFRRALRMTAALMGTGVIAVCILWAFYGFRFAAREHGQPMNPSLDVYARQVVKISEANTILTFARWHLVPEAYLYGLADVRMIESGSSTYLFGKVYPHGRWFYFPAAFVIKTPLVLLALLILAPFLVSRANKKSREILFLAIPPFLYFVVAMITGLNIGVRHILPMYPFLFVLAGAAAASLIGRDRRWTYAIVAILLFHMLSSFRAFPTYLAYSNELWGGPRHTYKLLSDSNADWGQQLKTVKRYLDQHQIRECWFAYFADVVADPSYYGIPCKPLTTIASVWLKPEREVPSAIDGTVLVSAGTLSGYEFGPDELNPYAQFQKLTPVAALEDAVFVYQGHFEIPLAAALNHLTRASLLQREHRDEEALAETRIAMELAPDSVWTQAALGRLLMGLKRDSEARPVLERALRLAQTVHPEFQAHWVPGLERDLAAR